MKIKIKEGEEFINISDTKITFKIGYTEYRIKENNRGELVINKLSLNEGSIIVRPISCDEVAMT